LKRERKKGWVILGRSKKTGKLIGRIENSFSMGFSKEFVRVYYVETWYDDTAKKTVGFLLNTVAAYNQKHVSHDWFIARIGSKKCPIKINWNSFYGRLKTGEYVKKYYWRNLPFKEKECISR
jgi:hypothetical protein